MVLMPSVWNRFWFVGACARPSVRYLERTATAAVIVAIAQFLPAFVSSAEFKDVIIATGAQLEKEFASLTQDRDVAVGVKCFEDANLKPSLDGMATIRFRVVETDDRFSIFIVPFTDATQEEQSLHAMVAAQGPKGTKVFLGEITPLHEGANEKSDIDVVDEKEVVDGKILPSTGSLKNWLKCSVTGCASAFGCFIGGPSWVPCFCLSCGMVTLTCGVTELFFP